MLLMDALARGAKVEWGPEGRPQLLVPQGMTQALARVKALIREVLRRATIFRAQISDSVVAPFMHLPEAEGLEPGKEECLSCAGSLPEGCRQRCPTCQAASWIALGIKPPSSLREVRPPQAP